MCPKAQLTGLHPRSEELVELTRSYDRGRANWAEVEKKMAAETSDLIQLQQELGFEFVSDGALSWPDPLRPLVHALSGVEAGTRYSRWFDTNTFYQKPIVKDRVQSGKPALQNFLKTTLMPKGAKWKVTLPGPYTFSELSENHHYDRKQDLVLDVADAEAEVIKGLVGQGVSLVQISEPCLVYRPYRQEDFTQDENQLATEAIRRLTKGVQSHFLVHTFFGDATPVLDNLLNLPVDAVGLDLYETDSHSLKFRTDKQVVLGIADSRESHVEDPDWIAKTAFELSKQIHAARVSVAPNSDLKFLPRATADKKVRALGESARILEGSQ